MAVTTLTYFDFSGSRGEECRLALHIAGVPFVDERLNGAQWKERKPHTPFGALPVLTVEGHGPIAQSNTILRLVGREHGLIPTEAWEAARHESIMESVEDLRAQLGTTTRIKDEADKKRAREELATGYLKDWSACVEKQLVDGPFVGGAGIGVADLKLYVVMTPILAGRIDHIPAESFKPFPRLLRLYEAVKTHPKVAEWTARH